MALTVPRPTSGVSSQAIAALRMRAAQQIAALRMSRVVHQAKTQPQRFAAANKLLKDGDLATACLIYQRLAASRPPTAYSSQAQATIRNLQAQVRKELREINARLSSLAKQSDRHSTELAAGVLSAFQGYEELLQKYASVPVVNKEVRRQIRRQQNNAEYLAILRAGEAHRLLVLGGQYETEGQMCCAYQVYEQAAELTPAPAARDAKAMLIRLTQNPAVVESVAECRKLQVCHAEFERAELMSLINPDQARKCYDQICSQAPQGSSLFLAAADRRRALGNQD